MQDTAQVTKFLASWIHSCQRSDVPKSVSDQALRTFFNWFGCAIGGARHETVDRAIQAVSPFSGPATSSVIGRPERTDALHAALLNGISSHVLDYDDTHLKTIIHPAGPVASALLAVAEIRPVSGAELLHAMTIGIEVECRIGNAVYPDHYDQGWHITGTTGVFGAAAAVSKLIGLDQQKTIWALGLAATQASNLREMFGTMTKSFHPGRAAQNGAMAAFLAEAGFDSSERAIEAPRGFANVLSTKQNYSEITSGLGAVWEAELNSYKPFACGIVIHPAIDGCIQLSRDLGDRVNEIAAVELETHPLVLELTGKTEPSTGLESKFSVFHAAAAALIKRDGAPTAFTDELVNDQSIISLRRKVRATISTTMHEDAVKIRIRLNDGTAVEKHVEHALGSLDRPLSNAQLDDKFVRQAALVVGNEEAVRLARLAWDFAATKDAGAIARETQMHDAHR